MPGLLHLSIVHGTVLPHGECSVGLSFDGWKGGEVGEGRKLPSVDHHYVTHVLFISRLQVRFDNVITHWSRNDSGNFRNTVTTHVKISAVRLPKK